MVASTHQMFTFFHEPWKKERSISFKWPRENFSSFFYGDDLLFFFTSKACCWLDFSSLWPLFWVFKIVMILQRPPEWKLLNINVSLTNPYSWNDLSLSGLPEKAFAVTPFKNGSWDRWWHIAPPQMAALWVQTERQVLIQYSQDLCCPPVRQLSWGMSHTCVSPPRFTQQIQIKGEPSRAWRMGVVKRSEASRGGRKSGAYFTLLYVLHLFGNAAD